MRAVLFALGLITAALVAPRPAAADVYTYIAVTCDSAANRAMVRFGHTYGDDPPKFLPLPGAGPQDLSTRELKDVRPEGVLHDDHAQEASCRLPDGREVKARYGRSPAPDGMFKGRLEPMFSVWLGQAKLISRANLGVPDCEYCFVHSVLLENGTTVRCDFIQTENDAWSDPKSSQIKCGKPAPAVGRRDAIEYPRTGSAKPPRVGALQVERGAEDKVCRALVFDESTLGPDDSAGRDLWNNVPLGSEALSFRAVGGESPPLREAAMVWPEGANGGYVQDRAVFENDGRAMRIYRVFGRNTYFNGDLLLATPETVPEAEVTALITEALSPAGGVDDLPAEARKRGWTAYSGDDTPFHDVRYTNLEPFRFEGAQYLLFQRTGYEPAGVVLKPGPKGTFERSCILRNVWPNF